ncbi:16966_t:CDS:1, partial [Dentiscutata heterogama]
MCNIFQSNKREPQNSKIQEEEILDCNTSQMIYQSNTKKTQLKVETVSIETEPIPLVVEI